MILLQGIDNRSPANHNSLWDKWLQKKEPPGLSLTCHKGRRSVANLGWQINPVERLARRRTRAVSGNLAPGITGRVRQGASRAHHAVYLIRNNGASLDAPYPPNGEGGIRTPGTV